MDVILVLVTACLWTPLVIVLSFARLLADGRPIFFRQVRVGRNGRHFIIFKIATTPTTFVGNEKDWPSESFPPRTTFGEWIRYRDFDELPQLWNVLKGEMSLVGPRPETPYHTNRFCTDVPNFALRVSVLPGLTGLSQVRGLRGDTSITARVLSDIEYLRLRGPKVYCSLLKRTMMMEARKCLHI